MKRKPCIKNEDDNTEMTQNNIKICVSNQEGGFQTLELNQSLHLQYYGFINIDNLSPFKKLHTLFLNNNVIESIEHLEDLTELVTLNLSFNRIKKITNLNTLHQLYTLDLSFNKISSIPQEQISGLKSLYNFKISQNVLTKFEDIAGLAVLAPTLSYLDLSKNQDLEYNPLVHTELLPKLNLLILSIQNTTFSRSAPNYRKETIAIAKSLKFLDDRPVTGDERMLAEAWKKGGLVLEKEMRGKIKEKTIEKNNKIYLQMEERTQMAELKQKRVLDKLTHKESKLLDKLKKERKSQNFELLGEEEQNILNLRIEELDKYLERMGEYVKTLDLDKELNDGKVELPKMINDQQTPEAIYIYNVSQEQLPLIKEKYYPQETRPLIAVSNTPPEESRWVNEYEQILHETYQQCKGNLDLLLPLFNMAIFEFDENTRRKVRRFQLDELQKRFKNMTIEEDSRKKSLQVLDELD